MSSENHRQEYDIMLRVTSTDLFLPLTNGGYTVADYRLALPDHLHLHR